MRVSISNRIRRLGRFLAAGAFCVLALAAAPAHAVRPSLFETSFHHENDLSRFSIAAHVDPDGILDLLTCTTDDKLLIRLGLGDGRFVTRDSVVVVQGRDLVTGDLNGDTHLDVVISKYGWAEVIRLLGNGDGTFGPSLAFPLREPASAIALADLDLDGELDLIVTKYNTDSLTVLLGLGNGNFTPTADYFTPNPVQVAVGKIGSDPYPDVIVGQDPGGLLVLSGGPQGVLSPAVSYPVHAQRGVAAGPVYGTLSNPRDAIASVGNDSLTVCWPNVDGTVVPWDFQSAGSFPERPLIVAEGVVVPGPMLHMFHHLPNGRVGPAKLSAGRDTWMTPGDFNQDNFLDLYGRSGLWLGNGDGTFGTKWTVEVGADPAATVVGDLDGDGDQDLVVSSRAGSSFRSLRQTPNGFQLEGVWGLLGARVVALRDLDGDTKLDLVVTGQTHVAVYRGLGDCFFETGTTFYNSNGLVLDVALGDLNGDANVDLLVTEGDSLLAILGNGTIVQGTVYPGCCRSWASAPRTCVIADVDRDGRADAVTGSWSSGLWVALGRGDGTFDPAQPAGLAGQSIIDVVTGDLDGDGDADIVASSANPDRRITAVLGHGDGTFDSEWIVYGDDFLPNSVALLDADRNGTLDIAAALKGFEPVMLYPGNGDGTFQPGTGLGAWWRPTHVLAAEMTGDSRPELVVTSEESNRVTIFRNTGLGYAAVDPAPSRPPASAFPNPARGPVRIDLTLVRPSRVEVVVRDISGRTVRRMNESLMAAGPHQLNWDGNDEAGRRVPSGLYFVELRSADRRETRRVTMLR